MLRSFPSLTETFVLNEVLSLEAAGERVLVDSLRSPDAGPVHPQASRLHTVIRDLSALPHGRRARVRAHARLLLEHPVRWVREVWRARSDGTLPAFRIAGLIARRALAADVRHIHVHFAYNADPALHAAALAGVPCSVHAHAWDIFHESQAPLLRSRLERAAAVTSESEHNVSHLRRELPGVHVEHSPPGMPLGPAATVSPDGPIVSVARLISKKGLDVLIDALPHVLSEASEVSVDVLGDGPLREALELQARALGLGERFVLRGSVPSDVVQAALGSCSMFVLPCRIDADGDRDGLPTVFIEALARGVPVITTDIVGISELVRDGETGLLVPPDDPEALAEAILALRADPDWARRLGRAGRELVAERHSEAAAVRRLQTLFA